MAINLAEAFSKKVAEAFKQDSLTDSATGHDYSFSGTRTVRVWSVDTVPLVDYQRTGSNRYGTPVELGDTVQEMTMRDEKSWTFTIDKGNQSDQYNIKGATRAAKRQIEQQVIPYVDKYRFREWCTNAGIIEGLSAAPTKGDIVDAIFDAGAAMSDRLVPWSNRTLYIPNEYFKLLALSDQFISIEALGKKSVSKGEVGEIDNMVVKRVPASYLPAGVYFLVKYKGSTVDPVKLNDMKIHQDPPGIGGNLLEGRIYHDSFVLGTKANGLYVAGASGSVTAAPTIKDTTGTVTITKKGTCKYTVDGTDPRYSATAQVYSNTFSAEKGVVVKAVDVETGKFPSAVASYTVVGAGGNRDKGKRPARLPTERRKNGVATTAQWIFEKAMNLMDEVNESTGATDTADTREYKNRTIPILNILRVECFPASDTYRVTEPGKRPICPEIADFDTPIGLDDGICQGVLPYGLAAHLLLDENPDVAAYFNQRYDELLEEYRSAIPAQAEDIETMYGGIEYGCFGRW